jgi:hypothetical protein
MLRLYARISIYMQDEVHSYVDNIININQGVQFCSILLIKSKDIDIDHIQEYKSREIYKYTLKTQKLIRYFLK